MNVRLLVLAISGLAIVSNAAAQRRVQVPGKDELARRVQPLSAELATMIRVPDTQVEQLPTPFFDKGWVCRVTHVTRTSPVVFTVGGADSNFAVLLAANPKGFFELATKAGTHLASGDDVVQYVTTFLLATRDFGERFEIVHAASDISLIPHATEEQKAKYKSLTEKYAEVIHPPVPDGARSVKAFAIVGQDLVEIDAKVLHDGVIERSDQVLERDLPIAVAQ